MTAVRLIDKYHQMKRKVVEKMRYDEEWLLTTDTSILN